MRGSSRRAPYSSHQGSYRDRANHSGSQSLKVYYCLCANVFKVNAAQASPKLIERQDATLEKQYPFACSRCQLQIGYEHTPPPLKSGGKFTYILPGALTDRQGVPPSDAFLQDLLTAQDETKHQPDNPTASGQ